MLIYIWYFRKSGTGKTTVARLVAEILYNLNYIKQDKLIEVSSKTWFAEYMLVKQHQKLWQ